MKPLGRKKQNKIPERWWTGGTLMESTLEQWHQATFGNGLATCAAWVYEFDKFPNKTPSLDIRNKAGELDPVKYLGASLQLTNAITLSSKDHPEAGYLKSAELALVGAYVMGWLDDTQNQTDSFQHGQIKQSLAEYVQSQKG